MKKKKVFITGSTGFFAKTLIPKIKSLDSDLYLSSLEEDKINHVRKLDLANITKLQKIIASVKPEVVIHLAANVNLARDFAISQKNIEINLKGTINLLQALHNSPLEKFIFTSTEEIYGSGPIPYKENQLPNPPSSYSITKLAGEYFAKIYAQKFNFSLYIFRIATMFGPGDSPHRLIPHIILNALKNQDIPLSSWRKKRDFIFVEDAVKAILKALHHKNKGIYTLNIGAGNSYTFKHIARTIIKITRSRSKFLPNIVPNRISEAHEWLMNIDQAKKILDWKPKTSLEDGLKKTINFFKGI